MISIPKWYIIGKITEYDKATSSIHPGSRRAQFYLLCTFSAPSDHASKSLEIQKDMQMDAMRFEKKLRGYGDGDSFGNGFLPSPGWKVVFWGEHYVKLLKIKIKYDPDNLFSCYHCVGSDRTDMKNIYESSRASNTATCHILTVLLLLCTSGIYMY